MTSFANKFRPLQFQTYRGQGKQQGGVIDYITTVISKNCHPSSILITGLPGSGKTSLAKLYTKATLCYNRKPGEFEACGHCAICTEEDTTNISEYTVSQATDFKESLEELKEIIFSNPILQPHSREDNYRRFVILDEIQSASKQSLSALLKAIEFPPVTTTIVLVSMDFDKVDPIVKEAIESRCVERRLAQFNENDIADNLVDNQPELDYKAAIVIGKFAKGNMRKAWQILEGLNNYKTTEITSDIVYHCLAGGATDESRLLMWKALYKGDKQTVLNTVKIWTSATDENSIAALLVDDIISNDHLNKDCLNFLSAIGSWLSSIHRVSLAVLLLIYLNSQLISFKEELVSEEVSPSKEVEKTKSKLNLNVEELVVSKLTTAVAKTKNLKESEIILLNNSDTVDINNNAPVFLLIKSFGELYDIYNRS